MSIVPLRNTRCSYGANRPELVTLAADSGGCFEGEFGQTGGVSAAASLVLGAGAAGAGLAARYGYCASNRPDWVRFVGGSSGAGAGGTGGFVSLMMDFEGVSSFELVLQELAPEVESEDRFQVFDTGEPTYVVGIEILR